MIIIDNIFIFYIFIHLECHYEDWQNNSLSSDPPPFVIGSKVTLWICLALEFNIYIMKT
jgi:hypothetical protein